MDSFCGDHLCESIVACVVSSLSAHLSYSNPAVGPTNVICVAASPLGSVPTLAALKAGVGFPLHQGPPSRGIFVLTNSWLISKINIRSTLLHYFCSLNSAIKKVFRPLTWSDVNRVLSSIYSPSTNLHRVSSSPLLSTNSFTLLNHLFLFLYIRFGNLWCSIPITRGFIYLLSKGSF